MVSHKTEEGFTIVELVISLVVLSLFLTMFFQIFVTSTSQRVALMRRLNASDMAANNLRKWPSISLLPSTGTLPDGITTASTSCDSSGAPSSTSNRNNLTINPDAVGVDIRSSTQLETPLSPLNASTTQQHVYVVWPRGCSGGSPPALIKSTVIFDGPGGQETATRATFIN